MRSPAPGRVIGASGVGTPQGMLATGNPAWHASACAWITSDTATAPLTRTGLSAWQNTSIRRFVGASSECRTTTDGMPASRSQGDA